MATIYIRDVLPEVTETLKERAASEGQSLSVYLAAELSKIAGRPTNAEVISRLRAVDRSNGPTTAEILDAVAAGRR